MNVSGNDRILTLLPPTAPHARPRFQVRADLRARLVSHLEHRGLRVKDEVAPPPPLPAEVTMARDTPLAFLVAARDTFLAQIRR